MKREDWRYAYIEFYTWGDTIYGHFAVGFRDALGYYKPAKDSHKWAEKISIEQK